MRFLPLVECLQALETAPENARYAYKIKGEALADLALEPRLRHAPCLWVSTLRHDEPWPHLLNFQGEKLLVPAASLSWLLPALRQETQPMVRLGEPRFSQPNPVVEKLMPVLSLNDSLQEDPLDYHYLFEGEPYGGYHLQADPYARPLLNHQLLHRFFYRSFDIRFEFSLSTLASAREFQDLLKVSDSRLQTAFVQTRDWSSFNTKGPLFVTEDPANISKDSFELTQNLEKLYTWILNRTDRRYGR